jgi:acetyltransferase-like isoleucine patch superfamily enzyme
MNKKKPFKRCRQMWQKLRFNLMEDGYARAEFLRKRDILMGIGENVYYYSRIFPSDPKLLKLHSNISIATNVRFITHDRIDVVLSGMYEIPYRKRYDAIEVMDNVFIGADVIVLPKVRIGPNAIVGAGAVVTKDVLPGTIVGGNPARVIGSFNDLIRVRARHPKSARSVEKIWARFEKNHPVSIEELIADQDLTVPDLPKRLRKLQKDGQAKNGAAADGAAEPEETDLSRADRKE